MTLGYRRYLLATAGPISAAVGQFLITLQILKYSSPSEFGTYSFLFIALQLCLGVWSALFCAPLPTILPTGKDAVRRSILNGVFATSFAMTVLAFVAFLVIGVAMRLSTLDALLFGLFSAASLLRWLMRAYAYALGEPLRTAISDLTYSGSIFVGVGVITFFPAEALTTAYAFLLFGALIAMLPFGKRILRQQFALPTTSGIRGYRFMWRDHSRWALIGVITTEITGNAHAYVVTAVYGPSAFALLAAAAILVRPIGVIVNALSEFERPQMAMLLGAGNPAGGMRSIRAMRYVLLIAWFVNALAATLLMFTSPRLVFPLHYDLYELSIAAVLWTLIALVRVSRTPESTFLQAGGEFRWLAYASLIVCWFSMAMVILSIAAGGVVWSVLGILLGECALAVLIWRQARRLKQRLNSLSRLESIATSSG